jgi:WD40 repeat protein
VFAGAVAFAGAFARTFALVFAFAFPFAFTADANAQTAAPPNPAEAALLRPLLAVETGTHSAPVRRIDIASTRGVAVTAADDRTARVWDLTTGALRHVLRPFAFGAEGGRLYGVAIHPQEPLVAVAGSTGGVIAGPASHPHLIYLFNLESGALQATWDAKAGDIRKLAWSADGQVLFAGYNGTHGVRAFARDGRELLDDRFGGPVFGLAVHAGAGAGGLAAAVGLDGTLRTYRLAAGGVQRAASAALGARRAAGVAISPDGKQLAVAFATRGEGIELFDAATLQSLGKAAAPEAFYGDWRVLAWSADGRSIAVAGTASTRELRYPIVVLDAATRATLARVEVAGDSVTDLVALPGGGFGYASFDGSWGLAAVPGAALPRRVGAPVLAVRGNAPADLALSADGLTVRWGQRGPGRGLAFAFDRRRLTAGRALEGVALRAPETRGSGLQVGTEFLFDGTPPVIAGKAMALAPDERGRAVAVARTPQGTAALVGTNRALHRVDDAGNPVWRVAVDTEVRAVNTGAEGRLLVAAMADGTLRWHRTSDGALLLSLLAQEDGRWVAWTPGGHFDASAGADRIVGWALARGTAQAMDFFSLARFRERFNRPDVIDAVLATADEQTALAQLAAKAEAERAALQQEAERQAAAARQAEREAAERAERARVAAQQEAERRAAAERAAVTAAAAAELARQAEAARQAAIAQARAQAERDAAAAAAARAEAEARAAAERQRVEREATLAAERERQRLEAERVAAERQAREREQLAQQAAREAEERRRAEQARRALAELRAAEFPPAVQGVGEPRLKAQGNQITLPFALHSHSVAGGVDLAVRVAGRPAQPSEVVLPTALNGLAAGHARIELPPADGLNPITVEIIASNRYGHSEPLAFIIERELPPPPPGGWPGDLYVLAIGVAEYARPEYRLGLAAKDAADFAAAMKQQEGRQYRRVIVRTLTNAQATRAAVLREFDWLRASVGTHDTAMLFIAGHGVNDAQGQYFFMPHDAQHERLLSTGVPQAAIVSTLAQIRGRTLMFIDTCFAGNALGTLHKAPKKTERLMNDLSASENGVVVFASSTGHEESLEKDSWGNGAFTKALLEGLSGRADFMRAGRVTHAALNLFVSEEVSRLTEGRQRPVFISPRGVPDFALARL